MKVVHIISGLNLSSGGPSLSTWSLVKGLRQAGVASEIITYSAQNLQEKLIGTGDFVHSLPAPLELRFAYSAGFKDYLKAHPYKLYHGHGLWQYPVHAMASVARKTKTPYIISPRGMLYPEALKKSAWFKKMALPLFQRRDLTGAATLHATCMQEMEHIRALGIKTPVAVIPNAIDIKLPETKAKPTNSITRIGFMGRFAPIKNMETLIEAYAAVEKGHASIELVLIGDGPEAYKNELKAFVAHVGIKNIVFAGFLSGEERERVFQSLSVLVLPSKSENFGMVVPEALLRGIPVIASKGTPWAELESHNCGWWVDIGVEPLKEALEKALALPQSALQQMGQNGRKLVEEKYSIEAVAEQMLALYKWILKEGEKPGFVY